MCLTNAEGSVVFLVFHVPDYLYLHRILPTSTYIYRRVVCRATYAMRSVPLHVQYPTGGLCGRFSFVFFDLFEV